MANKYGFSLVQSANTAPDASLLRGIGLAYMFGSNFEAIPVTVSSSVGSCIVVDLPFSLSNLSSTAVTTYLTNLSYDTKTQGINEYSDKPYPVKGYLAVIFEAGSAVGKSDADLDNYLRFPVTYNVGGTPVNGYIKIGLCNSSQTDFYTPFSQATVAVFFQLPNSFLSAGSVMVASKPTLTGTSNPVVKPIVKPTIFASESNG